MDLETSVFLERQGRKGLKNSVSESKEDTATHSYTWFNSFAHEAKSRPEKLQDICCPAQLDK